MVEPGGLGWKAEHCAVRPGERQVATAAWRCFCARLMCAGGSTGGVLPLKRGMPAGCEQGIAMAGRRRAVMAIGSMLAVGCVLVAYVGYSDRAQAVGPADLVQHPSFAFGANAKSQELAIIQRALSDEEHGTTPRRVLEEEREEAAQQMAAVKAAKAAQAPPPQPAPKAAAPSPAPSAPRKAEPADGTAQAKVALSAKTAVASAPPVQKPAAAQGAVKAETLSAAVAYAPLEDAVKTKTLSAADADLNAWEAKEKQIQASFGKEISLEQMHTVTKVTHLKQKIMEQVLHALQEGKEKVAKLKSKEKAAVTVVKFDEKQANLEHQLQTVQARAVAKAEALERKLAAVNALEKKYDSNPAKPLSARLKEDYTAEDGDTQKNMRDKVKAVAYEKSQLDEDTLEKKLEDSLEREVLSMDKHPAVAKTPASTKGADSTGDSSMKASAAAPSGGSAPSTQAVGKKNEQAGAQHQQLKAGPEKTEKPEEKQANKSTDKGAKADGAGTHAKTAVVKTAVKHVKQVAVKHVKQVTPVAKPPVKKVLTESSVAPHVRMMPTVGSSSTGRSGGSSGEGDDSDGREAGKQTWKKGHSPADQIMREIARESPRADDETGSSEDSSAHQTLASVKSSRLQMTPSSSARHEVAVEAPAPVAPKPETKFAREVAWAEKHGMPAKLAQDPAKTPQVSWHCLFVALLVCGTACLWFRV
jgi:hypothetical protein